MTALRRRRNGVAATLPLTNLGTSPQPGAGVGVGGRGRWAACATHHRTERTSDRARLNALAIGEDATTASRGAIMATASGTLPGLARARASLYVHTRTLTI